MKSLYIHIPFCKKKCFYCSFVVTVGQEKRIKEYLQCLKKEAEAYREEIVQTVYIGGGTPALLGLEDLQDLTTIIENNFKFAPSLEMTIEANPEGLTIEKAKLLKALGFNRVSLGVQSLNDWYLKYLGRCHNRQKAIAAFDILRAAGHANINLDLMYSFPRQTQDDITKDINAITGLGSEHLSVYALTIEPHSRFFVQKVKLPDEQNQAEQYQFVVDGLTDHGFIQYEISNFSKKRKESLHNLNYWLGGDYIGLGVGAHSHCAGVRFWNTAKFSEYMARIKETGQAVDGREELSVQTQLMERILFGLRMNQGADLNQIQAVLKTSLSLEKEAIIEDLIKEEFLLRSGERLQATAKGRLLLDDICAKLI